MDDFSRLEQKLAKLRQRDRAPGEVRVLRGSAERLMAAILTEIDETILPRRLSFSVDGGDAVHFAVGNRRLQAMVAPPPGVSNAEKVANVALKSADDEAVAALKGVVEALLNGHEAVQVTSARFVDLSPPSDVGVPVDQLAQAWGLDALSTGAANPSAALGTLTEGLADQAQGWLRIEGEEVVAQGGSESVVSALSDGAAVFLDAYFSQKPKLEPEVPGPVGLVFGGSDGAAMVFIDAGDAMLFVRAEAVAAYGIAKEWQQLSAL